MTPQNLLAQKLEQLDEVAEELLDTPCYLGTLISDARRELLLFGGIQLHTREKLMLELERHDMHGRLNLL